MKNSVLNYLKQDAYKNIYILRAILNEIKGFHYKIELDSNQYIKGIVAIWENEKAVTLRGEKEFCIKWFHKLCDKYNFYDLEENLMHGLMEKYGYDIEEKNISYYLIMIYESNKLMNDKEKIPYKKVNKDEWGKISLLYSEKYNIKFTDFQPQNMEWLVVHDGKDIICNICLEKVGNETYVLSNFYTAPQKRNTGVGTRLLKSVFNDYEKCKFVLFVNIENKKAVKLYKRLGFIEYEKVANIEANGLNKETEG